MFDEASHADDATFQRVNKRRYRTKAEGPRSSVHAQAFAFKWEQFKM
jgi:hypothetical protein